MGNRRQGSTPRAEDIHVAARAGDVQTIQSISTSNPLAINSRDKHSRTPDLNLRLHLAAWAGQTETVSYLCKNKADVGAAAMDDMGAIHFASQKGHLEIVRILLSSGVSVKASNRKGFTPLHYASQGSHLELAKYLVRKGASLTVKTKAGKTPLDLATSEEVRSFLLECKALSEKPEKPVIISKEAEDHSPEKSLKDRDKDDAAKVEAGEEDVGDETKKRKAEEAENEGRPPEAKKAKVALNHLLAGNDIEEEDNQ